MRDPDTDFSTNGSQNTGSAETVEREKSLGELRRKLVAHFTYKAKEGGLAWLRI